MMHCNVSEEACRRLVFLCVNVGVCERGSMSDLPAVEFEPQAQLSVVDDHVSSHVLLSPDTV